MRKTSKLKRCGLGVEVGIQRRTCEVHKTRGNCCCFMPTQNSTKRCGCKKSEIEKNWKQILLTSDDKRGGRTHRVGGRRRDKVKDQTQSCAPGVERRRKHPTVRGERALIRVAFEVKSNLPLVFINIFKRFTRWKEVLWLRVCAVCGCVCCVGTDSSHIDFKTSVLSRAQGATRINLQQFESRWRSRW